MNRERSEAAYAAYIRLYNAFMASRFDSREEVDASADRVLVKHGLADLRLDAIAL